MISIIVFFFQAFSSNSVLSFIPCPLKGHHGTNSLISGDIWKMTKFKSQFVYHPTNKQRVKLHLSQDDEDVQEKIRRLAAEAKIRADAKKAGEEAEAKRMSVVRSIQAAYYHSDENRPNIGNDVSSSGVVSSLPLWRVHWTELPGRSNVLNIHNPVHTHMFEEVIRGPKPWYIGHLFLERTKSSSKIQKGPRLLGWDDEDFLNNTYSEDQNDDIVPVFSAKIGTIMRINDFRRVSDGRLILFVQGLERFMVKTVIRDRPYIIADVQIIPDLEEITFCLPIDQKMDSIDNEFYDDEWIQSMSEEQISPVRKQAIHESFHRWHEYEYDNLTKVPVRSDDIEISLSDIWGPDLAQVMPFASYSLTVDPELIPSKYFRQIDTSSSAQENDNIITSDTQNGKTETLEYRLLQKKLLQQPICHPEIRCHDDLSPDQLEEEIWICIDEYLRIQMEAKGKNLFSSEGEDHKLERFISPLLFLLPNNVIIDRRNDCVALKHLKETSVGYKKLSNVYPKHRRHRRLSYVSSVLLEYAGFDKEIRQMILEIPSTRGRLSIILGRFELMNSQLMNGEFS